MITTTPIGVLIFCSRSPLGRTRSSRTLPTGSGNAATSRKPLAMALIRLSSNLSRSSMAEESPILESAFISSSLAALIAGASFSSAPAMASKQAFFASVLNSANSRAAPLAAFASSVICSSNVIGQTYGKKGRGKTAKMPHASAAWEVGNRAGKRRNIRRAAL